MILTLVQDDTAPTLTFDLNANLTGATAVAHVRRTDRTAIDADPSEEVLTKTVTIGTVTAGPPPSTACSVDWSTGDLAYIGAHYLEVQVTYSNAKIQTFFVGTDNQSCRFLVREQIA